MLVRNRPEAYIAVVMTMLLFIAGLVLLIAGAEFLVRGSSALAAARGIPPLVIGLTFVAFGTSAPEFAVSLQSVLAGRPGMAVGNVVGSNIFNILFILGVSALIRPLAVSKTVIRFDVPVLIVVSVLTVLLARDGRFSRAEGLLLFILLPVYTVYLYYAARRDSGPAAGMPTAPARRYGTLVSFLQAAAGLVLLVYGARWLVAGAVATARLFGVGEAVVGLTVVAAGTSLPELATSVVAGLRGERDIAVGNIIGSNLFNLMGVLGFSALASPAPLAVTVPMLRLDLPLMAVTAAACLPVFFTGGCISRREGAFFLFSFLAYTAYLLISALKHPALPVYRTVMVFIAVPLSLVTLLAVTVQALRQKRS